MTQQFPDTETINAFNKTIADEFRANNGKVGGQFANADLLLLHTTGAKSGRPRVSPLAYFRIDGKLIVIGSFAGAPVSPAWVHNLRADPRARVEVGADQFDVTARELPADERGDLFDKVTAAAPGFAEYQAKTSRMIPLFELVRT
ncbi:nitroreductase family deazaflavin-dependent oxidoreductase [Mycobacterium sp.]|uniref:nitroreductase family deazaflavin-dependent oxidoreductase n=1 Tax=Mycobacterium sp. TaxID=1785 RepID=UPI0012111287|nr:nitroreductase family deazaflavin-dependent oxidoreductase [Mycobacterium sp.]TAM69161.1 MAG: nitroreductase family deazaflavin-dependent oxidoreductase [Mycobacterium sp.]